MKVKFSNSFLLKASIRLIFLMGIFNAFGCVNTPKKTEITLEGLRDRVPKLTENLDVHKLTTALSSDDAATIALSHNAQLAADMSLLGIAYSDLIEAGLIRNPRLDVLFPVGAKPFELLLNLPVEALWERPARVKASEKAYEQLATSLIQNGLNTIQDARIAHANFVLARKREQILRKASDLRKRIAMINSRRRVSAGELTQTDGLATEIDSASAEELWLRAGHETALAAIRFRVVLGVILNAHSLEVEISQPEVVAPASVEDLIEKAMEQRPDLRAAELAVLAAAERAKWESTRLTQLSLQLSSKRVGTNGILTGPGVSAELPIFNQNQGRKSRADAEVEQASRQYLALKQRVVFEVSEARQLLVQAQEVLKRTRENVLPLLEKSVDFAEKKYKQHAASYLFVLEQTRGLIDAQLRVADFEAAMLRADAYLKRSLGAG